MAMYFFYPQTFLTFGGRKLLMGYPQDIVDGARIVKIVFTILALFHDKKMQHSCDI